MPYIVISETRYYVTVKDDNELELRDAEICAHEGMLKFGLNGWVALECHRINDNEVVIVFERELSK